MITELKNYIGKLAMVKLGGLDVQVEIRDVKKSYGNTRYLITPVAGAGEVWVEKLELIK